MNINSLNSLSQHTPWAIAAIRIMVGIGFFAHGIQKITGPGIEGFGGMLGMMGIPLPEVMAAVVIAVELLGGLALILGLGTRFVSVLLGIVMLVAIFTAHLPNGFFFNSTTANPMGGFEYQLTLVVVFAALVVTGSGAASVDEVIARKTGGSPDQMAMAS